MSALRYWIWLSTRTLSRSEKARQLLEHFDTPEKIFFAGRSELDSLDFLTEKEKASLSEKKLEAAGKVIDQCRENGWQIITWQDTAYPERLRNIYDAPVVLYVRGQLGDVDDQPVVALVGTRFCTPYGLRMAERIGYELARAGCTVATGMARGIDTAAAMGALRGGGRVIGVAGTGLDVDYPPENSRLFDDVSRSGAIITEYAPGVGPTRTGFPRRNRILSGISVGVTVVEAPVKSGALITAEWALEQGRDVFAIPGNVDAPASEGSNRLLRDGAIVALSGTDIAEAYAARFPEIIREDPVGVFIEPDPNSLEKLNNRAENTENPQDSKKKEIDNAETMSYSNQQIKRSERTEDEWSILSAMKDDQTHVDEIINKCGLPASVVLPLLTMLEIEGLVEQKPGKFFCLNAIMSEE